VRFANQVLNAFRYQRSNQGHDPDQGFVSGFLNLVVRLKGVFNINGHSCFSYFPFIDSGHF